MKVIGLDLSLGKTGIARFDGSTITVKTDDKTGDLRLLHIQNEVRAALQPGIDLAVIEGPLSHGGFSLHILGMVHGAVRTVLMKNDVPYVLISPPTLKAYATGSGTAKKADMILAAYKRAGLEFKDDNQCDAWWLRQAGLDHLDEPEVVMPLAHRKKLDTVKNWPPIQVFGRHVNP